MKKIFEKIKEQCEKDVYGKKTLLKNLKATFFLFARKYFLWSNAVSILKELNSKQLKLVKFLCSNKNIFGAETNT